MTTITSNAGWVALNPDETKAIKMNWGGQYSSPRSHLTSDANEAELFASEENARLWADQFNRTHKNQCDFHVVYMVKQVAATLLYEEKI